MLIAGECVMPLLKYFAVVGLTLLGFKTLAGYYSAFFDGGALKYIGVS